ncbi:TetR/AcrR family transcriptional regulator [Extibacter muris]|uniref:TetR/AcrR family transcriptional regulator n=1 Tax=Extibacter muris TaxID=1796622 RepID=UPI001D05F5DD|nr:TetR/AcrR family transcriptional regulator [Extibacter muris]MCB6203532.1 TetR/AcrR family transcriptional regulator [Extibacter muris]MCQ4665723.1 TetR/AcrR family transcriptional regulator [Extibacter muris]MCQ4695216.1 TetR/AcrR family transcriptional regulator [Extibacter muris]
MEKKDLILETMLELLSEKKGESCSVSDIAKKAGIAKGGMYYYFKSKEEVFDALVERTYQTIIDDCQKIASAAGKNAIEKLKHLYIHYRSSIISSDLDVYLHKPQNVGIHQKSLAKILTSLSPIVAQIIEQGNEEKVFHCTYPLELSETILSVFCFLLDSGIFTWTPEQIERKLTILVSILESELGVPKGCIDFLNNTYR